METVQDSDGLVHRVKVQVGEHKPKKKQDSPFKPSVTARLIQKLGLLQSTHRHQYHGGP